MRTGSISATACASLRTISHAVSVDNVRRMIGTARRRRDGESKVRGATRYVGDMPVFGLLHARPVLAADAHARITAIDTSEAAAGPGVVAGLTAEDLPIQGGSGRAAEPLAREEIVWSGQPVALVVAETEAAAEDAAALVFVDAEPLEAVLDLEQALAPDAPQVRFTVKATDDDDASAAHGGGAGGETSTEGDGPNVAIRQRMRNGDAEAGLRDADVRVQGRFRTSWVHQAYLEPQSTLAWVEPDGTLVVHSSTQGAFMVRE